MNKYLPSKKFIKVIGAVIICGAVVLILSFLIGPKQSFKSKNTESPFVAEGAIENFYNTDSDKDKVFDWEEGLWGTDPLNPDTDKDGVTDGEEISANKEEIRIKNDVEGKESLPEDLNQTEIFARQLFSAASLAGQQGGLSVESMDAFSKSFGQAISDSKIEDPFSLVDLKLAAVAPADYKTELGKAFDPYLEAEISPFDTIYRFSTGDTSVGSDIDKLSEIYNGISNALINIKTPHNAAGIQLGLVNTTAKLSVAFINIKHLEEDPILAVVGFYQYQQYSTELEKTLGLLENYFKSNGII